MNALRKLPAARAALTMPQQPLPLRLRALVARWWSLALLVAVVVAGVVLGHYDSAGPR